MARNQSIIPSTMPLPPSQDLLLEHCHPAPDGCLLLLEGGDGSLADRLAGLVPGGRVLTLDRDIRNVQAAQTRLAAVPNAATNRQVLPDTPGWDWVLLDIPKERRFARTLLLAAWKVLKPGGTLLLSGPTRTGGKAVITDAERLFGEAKVLGYRKHQRVAACTRGESLPQPLPEPFQQIGVAPGSIYTYQVIRPQGILTLESHPGIFSWESLDAGTALLLEHLGVEPGMRVWDVGCGCGVIGLSAALAGARQVWLSDTNLLAIDYAQKNAARNRLHDHVLAFPSDGLERTEPDRSGTPLFDLILSNPAFHQGHTVDTSMADRLIHQAPLLLAQDGKLVLVANRFLNYDRSMSSYFSRVTRLAETRQYHLLQTEM